MRVYTAVATNRRVVFVLAASLVFSAHTVAEDAKFQSITPPEGWSSQTRQRSQVLSKTYREGTLKVHLFGWEAAEGRTPREFLQTNSAGAVPGEKVISEINKVVGGSGDSYVNVMRDVRRRRGQARISARFACPHTGYLRLVDSYMDRAVWLNEARQQTRADLLALVDTACRQGPPLKRPDISPATAPDGLGAIWHVADFVVGISGYEVSRWGAMVFADGSVTDEFSDTLALGRAASRRDNPKDWGRWRETAGDIEIKWNSGKDYNKYYLTQRTQPGGRDDRLDACFGSFFISSLPMAGSGAYSSATSSSRWCFSTNGRFSNESSASISASTGSSVIDSTTTGSGYSNSGLNGWYRIDGHVLQLIYDNGERKTTTIAFIDRDDPEERAVLIGSNYLD